MAQWDGGAMCQTANCTGINVRAHANAFMMNKFNAEQSQHRPPTVCCWPPSLTNCNNCLGRRIFKELQTTWQQLGWLHSILALITCWQFGEWSLGCWSFLIAQMMSAPGL